MRLPPLNALRAFEAAARHEGFVGAAEELHVSRGAISRHVKLLEDHLGLQLFRRTTRGVELTAAGRGYARSLADAFGRVSEATEALRRDAGDLRVICPPTTSVRWLLPRLPEFRARHPEIRLRLTTDFHSDGRFDIAEFDIGFSVSRWPSRGDGIETANLFPVRMTPACSPGMAERLSRPEDLAEVSLLHEALMRDDWGDWLAAFGVRGVDPASGDAFATLDLAVKAAVMGAGVVMADEVLCRDELESGLLVRPFPDKVATSRFGDICLVGASASWETPKLRAFRTWAMEQAAEERARLGG